MEHDNLRAALRWLVTCSEVDRAHRLGGALRYFWFFQGYLSEGRAWLAELLLLQASATPTSGRARVLSGASMLALLVGDYDASWTMGREAVTLWEQLDNPLEHALALVPLGSVTGIRGDRPQARALHQRGVELSRTAGSRLTEALHLHGLSELAFADGDYAEARARAEEALAVPRELGWTHPRNSPQILGMLGEVSLEAGDLVAARAHFEDGLAKARETGWGWGIALALVRVAHVAIEQGDEARACSLLTEGLLSHRAHGNRAGILSCLEACAHLEATRGHGEKALHLAGLATAMRAAIHAPASPTEQRRLERWLERARRSLGNQTADAVLAQAHAGSLEQAVDDALTALNRPMDEPAPPPGRSRARSSASALTRREQEVAALVALGAVEPRDRRRAGHQRADRGGARAQYAGQAPPQFASPACHVGGDASDRGHVARPLALSSSRLTASPSVLARIFPTSPRLGAGANVRRASRCLEWAHPPRAPGRPTRVENEEEADGTHH